jgi:Tfp pilus assembly protein PilF
VELALDEMCAAADADPSYAHVAFFLAHAARLAGRLDAEERRLALAQRALAADPALARAHREGAREHLSSGDLDSAEELIQLALAVAPADLQALDLAQTIEQARAVRGAGPM